MDNPISSNSFYDNDLMAGIQGAGKEKSAPGPASIEDAAPFQEPAPEEPAPEAAYADRPLAEFRAIYPNAIKLFIDTITMIINLIKNGETFLPVKQTGISPGEYWEEIDKLGYADMSFSELFSTFNGEPVKKPLSPLEADTPIRRVFESILARKKKGKHRQPTEIKSDLACVPNCMLINNLAKLIDAGNIYINPLPSLKIPRQIQVDISWLAQEDDVEVIGGKFTEADRHVFDALCVPFDTLDFDQTAFLSVNQIYQLMTGNEYAAISPQQEEEVYTALQRLQNIYIHADATIEMKYRKKNPLIIDGRMLSINDRTKLNGTIYFTLGYPPLLKYSKITDQIVRYDRALLHVLECVRNGQGNWILGKPVQTNERRRAINSHFLRRIAIMNNGIKRANEKYSKEVKKQKALAKKTPGKELPTPRYTWQSEFQKIVMEEEFFAKFGVVTAPDKSKVRAYVRDKLLPFYEAMGFIRGSSLETIGRGRTLRAITIFPTETPLKIAN